MKYNVFLENQQGEQLCFEYRLHDTRLVQRFIGLTQDAIARAAKPNGCYFSTRLSAQELQSKLEYMRGLVRQVASHGIWPMPDYPLHADTVTQSMLNHLHQLFHRFEETSHLPDALQPSDLLTWRRRDPDGYRSAHDKLHELNIVIHHVEHALKSRDSFSWHFFGYHLSPQDKIPLEEADYLAMTAQVKFGDLTLCYGTAGKNLYTCFLDNDMEVVRSGEVRQQVTLSTGVLAAFPTDEAYRTSAEYERKQYEAYYAWCDKNQVTTHGHDYQQPKYRLGNIPLGELVNGSYTWDDMGVIVREYTRINRVELST